MEYASNAKGNLGVTLGAIGTGLGILDGGASMLGKVLGNNSTSEGATVSRYELGLVTDTINEKIENSYLRGQLDFANKSAEQSAINATLATQVGTLQNSFNNLTRVFIPNENVAPGWGNANVQPAPPMPPYPYFYPYPPFAPFPPVQEVASTTTNTTNG